MQLRSTITVLQTTPVEPSLQQPVPSPSSLGSSASSSRGAAAASHLYDFVDDAASAGLNASLRACIDRYHIARGSLADTADLLYARINEISAAISSEAELETGRSPNPHSSAYEADTLPPFFRTLESHATEAADLLQSLVRHYDLCRTALRHTEGGGEAAAEELGLAEGEEGASDVLQRSGDEHDSEAPRVPLTDVERAEMMAVLDKDAAQVDDVVSEIRDRLSEMESALSSLTEALDFHRAEHNRLIEATRLARALVPSHEEENGNTVGAGAMVQAAAAFSAAWEAERERILQARGELEALTEFYDGFAAAYDGLLLEVARRAEAQRRLAKVSRDAATKLERMASTLR